MTSGQQRSVSQRVRYRFDNTISRGTLPVIGYLARYVDVGRTVTFADVVAGARHRGEVALGCRLAERDGAEAEVVVNPRKSSELRLGPDDRVVVIGPPE